MFFKNYISKYIVFYRLYLRYFELKNKFKIKKKTYSQFEEDIFIDNFFKTFIGTYVDIGCYHPFKYNNTALLFNKGWKGINIDLNPSSIDLFNIVRKNDKNIVACLSDKNEVVTVFYDNKFSALNSIYSNNVKKFNIDDYKKIKTKTKIFSDLVKDNFDFLNIDCEGHDFKILKSINFNKYTPKLISIEAGLGNDTKGIKNYLVSFNYKFLIKKGETHLYAKFN